MEQSKKCRNCGEIKYIYEYPHFSTLEAGRKNTCKSCSNKLSKLRNKLRSENPPPDSGFCPICNFYTEKWILDHCHTSNDFRGYICNNCNLGIGRFYDDVEYLKKAIVYLQGDVSKNTVPDFCIWWYIGKYLFVIFSKKEGVYIYKFITREDIDGLLCI